MALPDGFLDELKSRIRLSDLIGRTVALRRQGREYAGLSPFKKERTPSFFVNDEKNFYHCFSSQKHGDAITWLQETQGLSFMEVVETLAAEAGLAVPEASPAAKARAERSKDLRHWTEAAAAWFARQLQGSAGREARAYLERRGLSQSDIDAFGLGYAPGAWRSLQSYLLSQGARLDDLIEAGLSIRPEDGGEPYDRFRDRVIFPIGDVRGRVIAFGGRALSKEVRAKYLNSPETPLFHKGASLYRYFEARRAAAAPAAPAKGLIVAEGYMDVIAFHRAGLGHAVAPLGTAVTEDQLRLLWRAGAEPILCLDGDSAGRNAAYLAAERALPLLEPGLTVRFAFLPEGQDPDDLLRAAGPEGLRAALAEPKALVDALWEREYAREPLTDPDRRAGFRRRLKALAAKIADPDVRAEYRAEFDRRLAALFQAPARTARRVAAERGAGAWGPPPGPSVELKRLRKRARAPADVRHLLLACLEWPEIAAAEAESLADLPCADLAPMREAVLGALSERSTWDRDSLAAALAARGFGSALNRLSMERAAMRAAFGGQEADIETRRRAWRSRLDAYMQRVTPEAADEARAALAAVVGAGDGDQVRRFLGALRRNSKGGSSG